MTLARTLSNTFADIAPGSAPMFVLVQLLVGGLAIGVVRVLYPQAAALAADVTHLPAQSPVRAGAATA